MEWIRCVNEVRCYTIYMTLISYPSQICFTYENGDFANRYVLMAFIINLLFRACNDYYGAKQLTPRSLAVTDSSSPVRLDE